ncbi:DNA polymerase eta-like isoform X3 [Chenopodium quinoa]|uniref:DNA polymerase eta-like isoform X3 n=1 Tax=Chenopodium quinoa TaxID=63459 RepID=UPI000B794F9F|nr:DNA polymerase eta-like isoform X3 [Chenopodium quinoa]
MPVAKPASSEARVIAHLDMDCFYVQVEQRKQPQLRGLPTAVVQYNEWKGGGLIAVSYEARKFGVKRSMRGDEAKSVCPQIQLVQVPIARGKADLSIYRDAGSEVVSILAKMGRCERASIDEVYLDLTDAAETMLAESPPESLDDEALKSHVLGLVDDGTDAKECVKIWLQRSDADHNDKLLSCGALIVAELRNNVLKETEFTCSAGIAHNKMLAKLASGLNKPAQQTIVPSASVKEFLGPWPIKKMKQLGGKLGDSLQSDLGINTVGDLLQYSEQKLQERYGFNTGAWLWNIARGVSGEEVKGRILPQSHGSGKTFPGPRALRSIDTVSHWLKKLCEELSERILADLDQNKRIAHTLTLHVRANKSSDTDSQKKFPSKSCPLRYGITKIQEDALSLFHAGLREFMGTYVARSEKNQNNEWGVTGLSVSASKIISAPQGTCSIRKFFPSQCAVSTISSEDTNNDPNLEWSAENNWNSESGAFVEMEDNTIMHDISSLDPNVDERKSQKNQGQATSFSLLKNAKTSCALLDPTTQPYSLDQVTVDRTLQLDRKGSRNCSDIVQDGPHYKFHDKDPTFLAIPGPKIWDQEVKKSKAKGTPSIMKFLKRPEHSCSQLKHEPNAKLQTIHMPTCSGGNMHQNTENAVERENWSYDVDEIDPTIVEELPADIQKELRGWMRPLKQRHSAKHSSITSYFLPSKDSSQ